MDFSSPLYYEAPSSSQLYPTSTMECSMHFQHNVWTKIVEEILPSAGPSIIRAARAKKYRPGPTNNESYLVCKTSCLCIYHLSGCTTCDSLTGLADTTCCRHLWTVGTFSIFDNGPQHPTASCEASVWFCLWKCSYH